MDDAKVSPTVSILDMEEGVPSSKLSRPRQYSKNIKSFLRKSLDRRNKEEESPWPRIARHFLYILAPALVFGALAVMYIFTLPSIYILLTSNRVYHSLLIDFIRILSPKKLPDTGLSRIVAQWKEPGSTPSSPSWLPNFSKDITPKAIHSHNDYWRAVPVFEALSLGVTGVEADCHLVNGDLLVGHSKRSLRPNRTFRSLYLDPLTTILTNQNADNNATTISGVWDTAPTASIVLMTDLKTEGFSTHEAVQQQLQPFREKGWLTYWNGTAVVPGPIIHVGTGNTPLSAVLNSTFSNSTYRDVFFDAPLDALTSDYNYTNSYYASTSLSKMFWHIPLSGLSEARLEIVNKQIETAKSLGLVSRYWDTPSWPVTRRMNVWRQLVDADVGMLNADQIYEAARWNWKWCNVLGLHLC